MSADRIGGSRGSATVLLMVAVLLAGTAAVAVGRAGSIAAARLRADLVAESVTASVASDLVVGMDPATAMARGRALARRAGAVVERLTVRDGVIATRVRRCGESGAAAAVLEP